MRMKGTFGDGFVGVTQLRIEGGEERHARKLVHKLAGTEHEVGM